jgi:hypothetical protein
MGKYVRDNGLKIQQPAEGLRDYLKGEADGLRLQKEFARIIKQ